MARFYLQWEIDNNKATEDRAELKKRYQAFVAVIKKQLADGQLKEYGAFAGESTGYAIVEGTAKDVHALVTIYSPYVTFTPHSPLSIDEVAEVIEGM